MDGQISAGDITSIVRQRGLTPAPHIAYRLSQAPVKFGDCALFAYLIALNHYRLTI
jgi:hypothetical protein